MRRHAESLIVLAGDSPNRAFRDAVPFVDVLRAATAEVEDYTRVKVVCRTSAALASRAAADVIHMLAEFVENATTFSPPNTEVRVTGDLVAKGLAVDIEDRGLGMDEGEFAAVNATLADPPLFDPSGSDRLGLFVAAQLAQRHDIQVRLRPSDYGGVLAIVLIPITLVVPGDGAAGRLVAPPREVTAPRPPIREVTAPPMSRAPSASPAAAREVTAVTTPPASPTSPWETTVPPVPAWETTVPPPAPVPSGGNGAHAAAPSPSEVTAPDEPQPVGARTGLTENGLPQRVRQMSLAPQLRDSVGAQPLAAPVGSPPRSPEKARSVMSAFRQGWRLGQSDNGGKQGHLSPHRSPAPPPSSPASPPPPFSPDLPQEGDNR
jgi:hypothetical protein